MDDSFCYIALRFWFLGTMVAGADVCSRTTQPMLTTVHLLSNQYMVLSSKIARAYAPLTAGRLGHSRAIWYVVCTSDPHSSVADGARTHMKMFKLNRLNTVQRRLNLTYRYVGLGRDIQAELVLTSGMKSLRLGVTYLLLWSPHSVFRVFHTPCLVTHRDAQRCGFDGVDWLMRRTRNNGVSTFCCHCILSGGLERRSLAGVQDSKRGMQKTVLRRISAGWITVSNSGDSRI